LTKGAPKRLCANARPEHIRVGRARFRAVSLELENHAEIESNVIERSGGLRGTKLLGEVRIEKQVIELYRTNGKVFSRVDVQACADATAAAKSSMDTTTMIFLTDFLPFEVYSVVCPLKGKTACNEPNPGYQHSIFRYAIAFCQELDG
jgi:hypothetical protein